MTTTDSIANMISLINNGIRAKLIQVIVPHSSNKEALLNVLKDEGYIESFFVEEIRKGIKTIAVGLKYTKNGISVINNLVKVSKPGRKLYSAIKGLKPYGSGMGMHILSTSKGIISEKTARSLNVGGEIICKVF